MSSATTSRLSRIPLFFSSLVLAAHTLAGSPALAATAPAVPAAPPAPAAAPTHPTDPLLTPPPDAPRTLRSWDEALAIVRAHSPEYQSTVQNVLRAEAQSRIALAAILPSVDAQGTFTHQFFTKDEEVEAGSAPVPLPLQDVTTVGATIVWNVGNARGYHALGTASRARDAAVADLAAARRTVAESLVGTMLATLAAARVAELDCVGLRASLERFDLADMKSRYGNGTPLDVDRAKQDVNAARALVIAGDEALRQSREALGLALGSHVAMAAPGDVALEPFERAVSATCHLNPDLERRADIVAARTRADVAERAVEDVSLQFWPSFSVQSQVGWGSQVLYGPNTTWNVKGVLTVPICGDGGARYGALRDTRASAEQSRLALERARLNALVEITQATRAVTVSRAARDVAQEQRDLAARIDERTRDGFAHGLGTSLDLVTSAQSLRQAEINLVLLQFKASQARVAAILANADCIF